MAVTVETKIVIGDKVVSIFKNRDKNVSRHCVWRHFLSLLETKLETYVESTCHCGTEMSHILSPIRFGENLT